MLVYRHVPYRLMVILRGKNTHKNGQGAVWECGHPTLVFQQQ
jgi:hypothetical protein